MISLFNYTCIIKFSLTCMLESILIMKLLKIVAKNSPGNRNYQKFIKQI